MSVDAVGGNTAELAQTILSGPLQMADVALQTAKVGMQMQLKANEMAQAQEVVAMMTGVGGNLNTYV